MKQKMMNALETFAKAMVQPLMYLSSAGILMVVGVLLTNSTITAMLPFLQAKPIQLFGNLIYNCVMVIINNLAVIFAIGIPAALAKRGGEAGFGWFHVLFDVFDYFQYDFD